jgi:hypothetical protein
MSCGAELFFAATRACVERAGCAACFDPAALTAVATTAPASARTATSVAAKTMRRVVNFMNLSN